MDAYDRGKHNMRNNNKKVINRLAIQSIKKNIRSIIMILSVVLINFMLYTIFSVGFSYYDNYKTLNNRLQGSMANVSFMNPTKKQLGEIHNLDYIADYGTQFYCGQVAQHYKSDSAIVMTYYSKNEWNKHIKPTISDFKGEYPKKENEIAISEWSLHQLNHNGGIGSKIALTYRVNDKEYSKKFVVTGIFRDYLLGTNGTSKSANVAAEILYNKTNGIYYNQYGNILVSKPFANKNEQVGSKVAMLELKDKAKDADKINNRLKKDLSISSNQNLMSFGLHTQSENGTQFVVASMLIACIIILSGYFLISNIMRISVVKEIHYYGQLKTIGATRKQLKHFVRRQVMIYGVLGTPVGIVLSVFFSLYFVPKIINLITAGSSIDGVLPISTSFNVLIFVFTVAFVFFTLFISCNKSVRIVNRITPVEAMKFNSAANLKSKRITIRSKTGGKIYKMALRNVFIDKEKAISVFISLFVGLLAFLTIHTAFSHPDYSIRFKRSQPYTFNIKNIPEPKNENSSWITKKDVKDIKNVNGVNHIVAVQATNVLLNPDASVFGKNIKSKLDFYDKSNEYYRENPQEYCATMVVLNEAQIDNFATYSKKYNKNAFIEGTAVIGMTNDIAPKSIGKNIEVTPMRTEEKMSFQLLNLFMQDSNYLKNAESYYIPDNDNIVLFVSEKGMERITNTPNIVELKIMSNRKYDKVINEKLETIFDLNKVEIKSQMATENSLSPMIEGLQIGGSCFSFILILIGVLNFMNVIITSVEIRKKELAILQAVGLSKKQLCRMLIYEALYYVGISILLIITIGVAITEVLVNILHQTMYYFTFMYPVVALCTLSIILIVICIGTSLLLYKYITKQSISTNINLNVD